MINILVVYFSEHGKTRQLAHWIAEGVERIEGAQANVRALPKVSAVSEQVEPEIPEQGAIYATQQELAECDGLALGSPTYFGNMAAPVKYFLDQSAGAWVQGQLANKPACVFTSTSSMHGGHESTLLSMMIPLMHHGMLMLGLPYSNSSLNTTQQGGTPYGAGHITGPNHDNPINEDEKSLAIALGERLAATAKKFK